MEDNEYATGKYLAWHPLGLTCVHHPLVQQAKKSFWQQRPALPKYYGIYSDEQVLKYISYLGENNTLNLKLLSRKTAFLVVLSTMYRCYYTSYEAEYLVLGNYTNIPSCLCSRVRSLYCLTLKGVIKDDSIVNIKGILRFIPSVLYWQCKNWDFSQ